MSRARLVVAVAAATFLPSAAWAFTGTGVNDGNRATAATEFRPLNTVAPSISGEPTEGRTLTSSAGTWTRQPASFAFSWERCDVTDTCTAVATGATYVPTIADVDARLRVVVAASNGGGTVRETSPMTETVQRKPAVNPPQVLQPPTLSGVPRTGHVLAADAGVWDPIPSQTSFQWLRCSPAGADCSPIVGATSRTRTLAPGDAGITLRVRVSVRTAEGPFATATSSASAPIARGYADEVLADRPIQFLRFASGTQPTTGPATTVHGDQADLTAAGAIATDAQPDRALSLRCCTSYGQLDDATFQRARTAELWFRTTRGGVLLGQQSGAPFSAAASYGNLLYVGTDGRLRMGWWDGSSVRSLASSPSVTDNMWHHAVAVKAPGRLVLYLDGARVGELTTTGSWERISGWTLLGHGITSSCCWTAVPAGTRSFVFEGSLDEVALYDHELSASRVRAHRLAGRP